MKNKRIFISWLLLLAWMLLIFIMSNQPGDVSREQSGFVIKLFALIGIELNRFLGEIATLVVRKGAHVTEYFILYFLVYNVLKNYYKSYKSLILSLLFIVTYSVIDEIHQYFIPGRTMAIKDVCIDTIGGVIALTINYFKIKRSYKANEKSKIRSRYLID